MIAVCPEYLKRGSCVQKKCLRAHVLNPEIVPTCVRFLIGNCTDLGCVYTHPAASLQSDACTEFAKLGYCKKGRACRSLHIQEIQQANLHAAHAGVKAANIPDFNSVNATTSNKQLTEEPASMADRKFCRFEGSENEEELVVGKGTPFEGFVDQSDFISLA